MSESLVQVQLVSVNIRWPKKKLAVVAVRIMNVIWIILFIKCTRTQEFNLANEFKTYNVQQYRNIQMSVTMLCVSRVSSAYWLKWPKFPRQYYTPPNLENLNIHGNNGKVIALSSGDCKFDNAFSHSWPGVQERKNGNNFIHPVNHRYSSQSSVSVSSQILKVWIALYKCSKALYKAEQK